jgi:hypothetical protein
LAICTWACFELPKRVRQSDCNFQLFFKFLFVRFHTGAYWFGAFMMNRNAILALIPLFGRLVYQVIGLQLAFLLYLAVLLRMMPWRIAFINWFDVLGHLVLISIVSLSAFFINDTEGMVSDVANFCVALLVVMLSVLPAALGRFIYTWLRNAKPFQYFLCHHKAGAGAFARLFKMRLVGINVWLDSDDLQNLDMLFEYVASQSDTVALLCSQDVLMRPWCMGELVTAHNHKVEVVPILFPGFVIPDDDWIKNYTRSVDITCLAEHGIDEIMVQNALRWLQPKFTDSHISWTGCLSKSLTTSICSRLLKRELGKQILVGVPDESANTVSQVGILVDHSNKEAEASALILLYLIFPLLVAEKAALVPEILESQSTLTNLKILVPFCSNGLFQQSDVLKMLSITSALSLNVVPILSDDNFRFPSAEFVEGLRSTIEGLDLCFGVLSSAITNLFKEIAIVFQPQLYSSTEGILLVKATEVKSRVLRHSKSSEKALRKAGTEKNVQWECESQKPKDLATCPDQAEVILSVPDDDREVILNSGDRLLADDQAFFDQLQAADEVFF